MVHGNLSFGDFNVPQKGDNLLGRIFYWASSWFTGQQTPNTGFWLPVSPDWLRIASQIQGLKLETHVNETVYVPYQPLVRFGLKAGTGDLFIVNEAYGDFLHKTFNISTIDTSDSAIALIEDYLYQKGYQKGSFRNLFRTKPEAMKEKELESS
ncbi:bark storage protein B-like [Jatropha curcas]|uniref:bark storage protein B-like n=1 Tax=Jatropha curcas TaxID=180498 RepID=UPI00189364B9|nr:bark storage protein B-like [Jatropha curcas]